MSKNDIVVYRSKNNKSKFRGRIINIRDFSERIILQKAERLIKQSNFRMRDFSDNCLFLQFQSNSGNLMIDMFIHINSIIPKININQNFCNKQFRNSFKKVRSKY